MKIGKTFLRRDSGKCIHYYFYFLDPELGLCYVRVPTWAPFRLQVYFNGHHWLAHRLEERGSKFTLADNAFLAIDDFAAAQRLSDGFDVKPLHKALDCFAAEFCPAAREFRCSFQWSLMQVEYATDIVFRIKDDLKDVYPAIIRTALSRAQAPTTTRRRQAGTWHFQVLPHRLRPPHRHRVTRHQGDDRCPGHCSRRCIVTKPPPHHP